MVEKRLAVGDGSLDFFVAFRLSRVGQGADLSCSFLTAADEKQVKLVKIRLLADRDLRHLWRHAAPLQTAAHAKCCPGRHRGSEDPNLGGDAQGSLIPQNLFPPRLLQPAAQIQHRRIRRRDEHRVFRRAHGVDRRGQCRNTLEFSSVHARILQGAGAARRRACPDTNTWANARPWRRAAQSPRPRSTMSVPSASRSLRQTTNVASSFSPAR